jgi:hypothetical protein
MQPFVSANRKSWHKIRWLQKSYRILQWFWSEYWWEVLDGNFSDDFAILQEFRSEFWSGNAAVYFLIRIPVRSRFVISMSAREIVQKNLIFLRIMQSFVSANSKSWYKIRWLQKSYRILQWFWSEYWWEVLDGNLSDEFAILQEFWSEFWSGNAAVYFFIRIPVRSRFVISMSADSMYF